MSIRHRAFIAGAYEHPTRKAPAVRLAWVPTQGGPPVPCFTPKEA
jgi:hypothetical protein